MQIETRRANAVSNPGTPQSPPPSTPKSPPASTARPAGPARGGWRGSRLHLRRMLRASSLFTTRDRAVPLSATVINPDWAQSVRAAPLLTLRLGALLPDVLVRFHCFPCRFLNSLTAAIGIQCAVSAAIFRWSSTCSGGIGTTIRPNDIRRGLTVLAPRPSVPDTRARPRRHYCARPPRWHTHRTDHRLPGRPEPWLRYPRSATSRTRQRLRLSDHPSRRTLAFHLPLCHQCLSQRNRVHPRNREFPRKPR